MATGETHHARNAIQLATMGAEIAQPVRQNIDRLAQAVDNLQVYGSTSTAGRTATLQREIVALRQQVEQLRTLLNSVNRRLTAAGF